MIDIVDLTILLLDILRDGGLILSMENWQDEVNGDWLVWLGL